VRPKKKRTSSSVKKKTSTKKRTGRSRSSGSKKKRNHKKHFITVFTVFLMIGFVIFGYHLGQENLNSNVHEETEDEYYESSYTTKQLLADLTKMQHQKPKVTPSPEPKKVVQKVRLKAKEPKPVQEVKKEIKKPQPKVRMAALDKKPKLVIIIDDISKESQLRIIKQTGLKLTPAIFPPSELSMISHHLASDLKHSMVHLPMESSSKQFNSQYKTLHTHFDKKQIVQRAKELRKLFPYAKYVNNHTGSVFTSDTWAMGTLYEALRNEGFIFVDSRTVAHSKVRQIAKRYGDTYVARDVFIDNQHSIAYIHKQLRKAVKIAKKKGYAIAIGHPHHITFAAIKSATSIFKEVDIVYIDEIYKEI